MRNDAGLFEAVHAFYNFDVNIALIINLFGEVVFINDFLRDVTQEKFHVFRLRQVIIEVEVFYIGRHAFGTRRGDNAVEEAFFRGDSGSGRGEDA